MQYTDKGTGRFLEIPLNDRYGMLTVIGYANKTKNGQYYCHCLCDCGKEIIVRKTLLTTGKQFSCGCYRKHIPVKENTYECCGEVTKILLENGEIAIVDTEDATRMLQHYWNKSGRYVRSYTANVPLHKFVMKTNKMLDHKNGNTLDNRKENLRYCTFQENAINRKLRKDNETGTTGVGSRNGKYFAEIKSGGVRRYKVFSRFEEAAKTRKEWENDLFGEWMRPR